MPSGKTPPKMNYSEKIKIEEESKKNYTLLAVFVVLIIAGAVLVLL